MSAQQLFIVAPHKTATSTLVGMLNCHPDIFVLYETHLHEPCLTKYGVRLLKAYPDARYLFSSCYNGHIEELYGGLAAYLGGKGQNYRYVGDKFVGLDERLLVETRNSKTICSIRDLRSWLCKDFVLERYLTRYDAVPTAIDYTSFFLKSFQRANILRLRFDEIIYQNKNIIGKIGAFLKLDLSVHLDTWWNKIADQDEHRPDQILGWWKRGHFSSLSEPKTEDVIVQIKDHPFWDRTLAIFDKYYENIEKNYDEHEIRKDLEELFRCREFSPLPLHQLYSGFENLAKNKKDKEEEKEKSGLAKVRATIKKKIKKTKRKIEKFRSSP